MKKIVFSLLVVALAVGASYAAAQTVGVRARVSWATPTQIGVYLDGWEAARSGESYTLYRNDGTGDTRINVGVAPFWRDTVSAGKSYTYRLTKNPGGDQGTATVNATIRPGTVVKGVGWSVMDDSGIGWISINSSSQEPTKGIHSSVPYGVYADDSGIMHGVMWAGHVSNPAVGWGWLSFNREDLTGCPDDNACRAFLNPATGKIDGWARFVNATGTSWSGWVSLRGNAGGANEYGLCFGDPTGTQREIAGKAYYSGSACVGNGGANHPVLTGAAWAGLNSDEPGGWIAFASSSLGVINPTSTLAGVAISPPPPHNVAIRDIKEFSANRPVAWFVDNTYGGNSRYGTVTPRDSGEYVPVSYLAPMTLPFPANTFIKASTTEPSDPGVDIDPLTVVPPYNLACIPEGETSIRIIITKNYKDPNYFGREPHDVYVKGATSSPPGVIIASSTTGTIGSFAHTGLAQKRKYYYVLETTYRRDNYLISTAVVTCQTGATPEPLGAAVNLNAYANTSRSIWVNWKDTSRATTPYEFEVQRIKVTPDRENLRLQFRPTSETRTEITWENDTLWVPYTQKLWRKDGPIEDFNLVLGAVGGWPYENPPTSTVRYAFSDAVALGQTYQYKLEVCANLNLSEVYSSPVRGGTGKPPLVCVESETFNYSHVWRGGGEGARAPETLAKATASLIDVSQRVLRSVWNSVYGLSEKVASGFRFAASSVSKLFGGGRGATVLAQTTNYNAYFKTAVITKNPSYLDGGSGPDGLEADTVYLYRVSILSDEPVWSNFRAAKTLKNDQGGPTTENRPVCTRNSFCDASVPGVTTGDLSESSEQQCFVNKDCVDVGRSDQGFQER